MISSGSGPNSLPAPLGDLVSRYETLKNALNEVLLRIQIGKRVSLGITGGAAVGLFDEFSDIDLVLAVDSPEGLIEGVDIARDALGSIGTPLVEFPADHLGASNLIVTYLRSGNRIFKADVLVLDISAHPTLPNKFLSIYDPADRFKLARQSIFNIDQELLLKKLTGWLWFTYTRICRGEFFAAARSLDFSREAALLPLILESHGLPQEGHRRLEMRLPATLLERLRGTYPAKLERSELMGCLRSLHALVDSEMSSRTVAATSRVRQSADEVWACIEASERERDNNRTAPAAPKTPESPSGVRHED